MNACWDLLGTALNHSMTFEVLLHRFAFVTLIISLFMLSKICLCLLIIPISDFVGFMSLHVGLFMKSGLWSFNVTNASLLAETSIRSSSLRLSAIFLSTAVIESGMRLFVFL